MCTNSIQKLSKSIQKSKLVCFENCIKIEPCFFWLYLNLFCLFKSEAFSNLNSIWFELFLNSKMPFKQKPKQTIRLDRAKLCLRPKSETGPAHLPLYLSPTLPSPSSLCESPTGGAHLQAPYLQPEDDPL